MISWYRSPPRPSPTRWTVLMHTGCSCLQERHHLWVKVETTPCTSLQSRVSLPYSPLLSVPFLPSPSLEVNSSSTPWCVAQGELVVPISLRRCSFLPPSRVQTAFPMASHKGYSFAGTGRTEPCRQGRGSFCNRGLGTDLRHCNRRGKSKTRDV